MNPISQKKSEKPLTQRWRVARSQDTTQRQQVQQLGQQRIDAGWGK